MDRQFCAAEPKASPLRRKVLKGRRIVEFRLDRMVLEAFRILCCIYFLCFSLDETAFAAPSSLNPDMSFNALMLYRNSSRGNYIDSAEQNGPSIQEAELQLFSNVDPYSKLNAVLSIHQDAPAAGKRDGDWKVEPEELFIDTTEIPLVTIRVGKFKGFLGKHNTLHTHVFPFIDAPLINTVLMGDEGLNDVGFSAGVLIPFPWFAEFTGQVFSGRTETTDASGAYFNSGSTNQNVLVGHIKNLLDLNDSLTAEAGISVASGANEFADANGLNQPGVTQFYGADLTFKWRPIEGGKSRALVWSTEYMNRKINRPLSVNSAGGFASWLQWQFAERWWLNMRGDYLEASDNDAAPLSIPQVSRRYTALLAYLPSEFSSVRFQYSQLSDGKAELEKKFLLQLNFTIGAHPAHSY